MVLTLCVSETFGPGDPFCLPRTPVSGVLVPPQPQGPSIRRPYGPSSDHRSILGSETPFRLWTGVGTGVPRRDGWIFSHTGEVTRGLGERPGPSDSPSSEVQPSTSPSPVDGCTDPRVPLPDSCFDLSYPRVSTVVEGKRCSSPSRPGVPSL